MAADHKIQVDVDGSASGGIKALQEFHAAANEHIGGITSGLGTLSGGINSVMGAFGVLGGVLAGGAAFRSMVSETVSWNLETAKLARTLGDTSQNASVMKVALHGLGIDQEVVSSAAMRMARTLNTNSDAFKRVGVDAEGMRAAGKSNTEIMMSTIQALGQYKGGLDRNQAAMTIFGRSWGELQQLMRLTPAIMNEARETAERLHLVVGQDGVSSALAYKRALNELSLVQDSIKVQIGKDLIPILTSLGITFGRVGGEAAHAFGDGLRDSIRLAMEWRERIQSILKEAGVVMNGGPLGSNWWTKKGRDEIGKELDAQEQLYRFGMEKIANEYGTANKAVSANPNDDKKSWDGTGAGAVDPAQALFDKYLGAREGLNKQLTSMNPDLTEMQRKFIDVDATVSRLTREMPEYTATWQDFGTKMKGNIKLTEQWKVATAEAKTEISAMEEVTKNTGSFKVFGASLGGILGQKKEQPKSQFSLDGSRAPKKNFGADLLGATPADQMGPTDREIEERKKIESEYEAWRGQIEGDTSAKQLLRVREQEDAWLKSYARMGGSFAENERRKTEVQKLSAAERARIAEDEEKKKLDIVIKAANSAMSLTDSLQKLSGTKSKEAFRAFQGIKSAETIVATAASAMNNYNEGSKEGGPYLGALYAAAAIAAGAVQLEAIWSANPSGGSGSVSNSSSGPGASGDPSSNMVSQPTGGINRGQGGVTVNVTGTIIGEDAWVQNNLIPTLNDALGRGVTLNLK